MKYKVIRDNYLRIDDQVNDHLAMGWELHGYPYAMGSIIMQAVVKNESAERGAQSETESGERRVESVGRNKSKTNAQV